MQQQQKMDFMCYKINMFISLIKNRKKQFRYVENQIANTKIIHVMPILLIRRIFRHMPEIFM